eukprot:CAMPEP_0119149756 /NCGR_PEP_ID=MMETSP1310-20130426/43802_1 /TAXON_ID=464262 /ORGANISM="Genus nov. species nov., Strain RCC2339" /LENGTH=402 /DNA_ID=CAMNT_0007141883 /DNA_START=244 /DNA_END=1452 /DNA_ORIENTATION=+
MVAGPSEQVVRGASKAKRRRQQQQGKGEVTLTRLVQRPVSGDLFPTAPCRTVPEGLARCTLMLSVVVPMAVVAGYVSGLTSVGLPTIRFDGTLPAIVGVTLYLYGHLVSVIRYSRPDQMITLVASGALFVGAFFALMLLPAESFSFDLRGDVFARVRARLAERELHEWIGWLRPPHLVAAVALVSGLMAGLLLLPFIRHARYAHGLPGGGQAVDLAVLLVRCSVLLSFCTPVVEEVLESVRIAYSPALRGAADLVRLVLIVGLEGYRLRHVRRALQVYLNSAQDEASRYQAQRNHSPDLLAVVLRRVACFPYSLYVIATEMMAPSVALVYAASSAALLSPAVPYPFLSADLAVGLLGTPVLLALAQYTVCWLTFTSIIFESSAKVYVRRTCTQSCCQTLGES